METLLADVDSASIIESTFMVAWFLKYILYIFLRFTMNVSFIGTRGQKQFSAYVETYLKHTY